MAETMSYWCYHCNRLVNVSDEATSTCPRCNSGFIEAGTGPSTTPVSLPESSRSSDGSAGNTAGVRPVSGRRRRRSTGDGDVTEMYNPIILLRSPNQVAGEVAGSDGGESSNGNEGGGERLYRLFYDGGAGTGLQPLPPSMSESLLGSGFDRLLDQLSQLEINKPESGPASKAAIESIPSVVIKPSHDCSDLSCVICHEEFDIGSEAREMPCKHLYHSDCIVSWLSIRNSCPICRHELPCETGNKLNLDPNQNSNNHNNGDSNNSPNENVPFGITIWRLPSGGYAIGRFMGSGNNALPRSVALDSRRRSGGGMRRRLFGGFVSFCKRVMSPPSSLSPPMSLSASEPGSPENLVTRTRRMSIS